jgi:circadian clock protein KaiC
MLRLEYLDPAEMTVAEFSRRMHRAVSDGTKVIVVDSVNGFLNAVPSEAYLSSQLHALLNYLSARSIVTILVLAQFGFIGASLKSPVDVSYLADNVILLRFFEAAGAVRKAVSVAKRRSGGHEPTIRELVLEGGQIRVGPPLSEFSGVLTGAPIYSGRTGGGGPLLPSARE